MKKRTPSAYWQEILEFESQRATELRQGVFKIIDEDGNDLVPGLIKRHDEQVAMAKAQLDFLIRQRRPL